MVWLRTGVSSENRPMFKKENRKCRACSEDSPWSVCPGACLWGRVGKSRYRRGCPDDKISLVFIVVCILDLCFSFCTIYSSHHTSVPLRVTSLLLSYLGRTWESLGLQVTSSVSFTSLLPPFPLYFPRSLRNHLSTCPFSPACR